MLLNDELRQKIMDLVQRVEILTTHYLTKASTEKRVSPQVKDYYNDTSKLAKEIRESIQ